MSEDNSATPEKSEKTLDLNRLREQIITMLAQQRAGDFEALIPLEKLGSAEKEIGSAFNELSQIHVGNILSVLEVVSAYADGDFSPVLQRLPGKQVYANEKMDLLRKNLRSLNEDMDFLTKGAFEGRLDIRVDATRHNGDYRKIIDGVNTTLDAFIGPFNVAAEYIERISEGDVPQKISEQYRGDFNEIKNNLNQLIDVIIMRGEDINLLTNAGLEGRLDARGDTSKYHGYHGGMIDKINKMLDAYIGPFNVSAEYIERISEGDIPQKITEQYRGDFNEIKNNLNKLIDVVNMRNADIQLLISAATEGKLDIRADSTKYNGLNGKMISGINAMLDAFIGPFNVSAEYIERISEGDIPQKITEQYRGDFNEIKNNLNKLIDVVNMRNSDIQLLIGAATEGKLDVRADSTKYHGLNGKMIDGINAILDSFIGPFNVSAEYIERISEGDIPQKITEQYRGDFNEIKNNLNKLIDVVNMRNGDIQLLINGATEGKLDVRADSTKYHGLNGKMIDGINKMLDSFIGPFNVAAEYIERISEGDIPQKITEQYRGDFNEIKNNLNKLIDVVNMRNGDIQLLISAATEGKLDVRADSTKYHGLNGKMIEGINAILNSFIGPFNVSAEYIERISEGDIPQKITEQYRGDFNEIKNNLNQLIDVVNMRNTDIQLLINGATEGKLDVRADSTKYNGLNGKMIDGINTMLDSFIGPFNVAAEYIERISEGDIPQKITDQYRGDFNEIKNNLNKLIDVVNMRNGDIQLLISAASDGKLDIRADSTKYHGLNGKMIEGINKMLDSFIGPLNVAAEYVDRISKGDIPKPISENYKGDFNEIKNNLNQCINAINLLIEDTNELANSAKRGDLDTKADKNRHMGKFADIINGINETLDGVILPLREGMRVCNEYAQCNLTAHFDEKVKVEGEFARFRESLDRIGADISHTIQSLKREIISLSKNADTAHVGVSDVSRGAHEISKNADEVSRNAEKSEEGITQVLRAMADLTTTVSEVSQNADAVARLSLQANNLAMEGSKHAGDAETGMISITKSSHEIETIVKEIKTEMDKIGKIVGIITDLANQTNLLALNAAIEAARAGDAGRGFAVVASEVKSLAQESRVSAESISDMISGLQRKTDNAANAMENAGKAVNAGNSALSDTLRSFTNLTQSVDTINQNMVSVASATEEQAASFEEITASVNEMSVLVKKTADDALHSSATSEEALAVVDQIIDIIKKINEAVDTMNDEVSKFKLRE